MRPAHHAYILGVVSVGALVSILTAASPFLTSAQVANPPDNYIEEFSVVKRGTGAGTVRSISSWPAPAISCGTVCVGTFSTGTTKTIQLVATPASGSTFAGWIACESTTRSCTVTTRDTTTVAAIFNIIPVNTITVNKTGSNLGKIVASTTGVPASTCPETEKSCSFTFKTGAKVTLTATAIPGSSFAGWGGSCGSTTPCVLTVSHDETISATFTPNSIRYEPVGTGAGSVKAYTIDGSEENWTHCKSAPASCALNASPATSKLVVFVATPDSDSTFTGWVKGCTGTSNICVLDTSKNVVQGIVYVEAKFTTIPARTITYTQTGSGWVAFYASSGYMGNCRQNCSISAKPSDSRTVVLVANPAIGSTFVGWSGGCVGTNPVCSTTSAQVKATFR